MHYSSVRTVLTANELSLVGFKVITGPNVEGTATIIKRVALVVDSVSCDSSMPAIMIPDRMEFIVGSSPTVYRNEVTMDTPWGEACPFTIEVGSTSAFFTATLDVGQRGFELSLGGISQLNADVDITLRLDDYPEVAFWTYTIHVEVFTSAFHTCPDCSPREEDIQKTVPVELAM